MQFQTALAGLLRESAWGLRFPLSRPAALPLVLVSALAIRLLGAVLFTGEIDTEGAEYARIAQNLLAGKGYVGIATPGTQLFFPPLFPFLIAGVSLIVGDAAMAGRIVSVLFGTLLILPVYLIARRMYGDRMGLAAAAVIAFHPYLVWFSTTVHCESVYLTLIMAAVYSAMRAAIDPAWRVLVMSGGLYGASYLVRPEALIFMLVAMGCILLGRLLLKHDRLGPTVGRLMVIPVVFAVVAGPYIGWLSLQAGHFRLEGKSPLNVVTELRMQQGQSNEQAGMGVDQGLTPRGVWNQPNINIIRSYHVSMKELATLIVRKTKTFLRDATDVVAGALPFGSPPLFAFAVLGLFGRPWPPALALDQLHLFVLAFLSVLATYFIYFVTLRFYILILIFFCIWVCPGADALRTWAQHSAALFGVGRRLQGAAGVAAVALAVVAIIGPAGAFAASEFATRLASRPIKVAATSMASSLASIRIADATTPFAFHAHADFVWLPYCDEVTALLFLQKMEVTHVVLRSNFVASRPYLKRWMTEGVAHAALKIEIVSFAGEKVQVYEIRPGL